MAHPSAPPLPKLAFDRGTLVVSGIPSGGAEALTRAAPFQWDERTGQWRCDARHYVTVRRALQGSVHDTLLPPQAVRWPRLELPELRPDQQRALAAWEEASRCGQIIMPTGTGKTVVALAAVASYPNRDREGAARPRIRTATVRERRDPVSEPRP